MRMRWNACASCAAWASNAGLRICSPRPGNPSPSTQTYPARKSRRLTAPPGCTRRATLWRNTLTWPRCSPCPVKPWPLSRDPRLQALDPAHTAFIDTETTGLSLGAGTYTFLIGIGTYENTAGAAYPAPLAGADAGLAGSDNTHDGTDPGTATSPDSGPAFVVRQYFMRSPGEERAQLHLVEEALSACSGIVSFNGRAFDLPLLQGRFIMAHMPPPLPGAPHLDLLPPARRLWRAHFGSCALGDLERNVLAKRRTAADVPGWMIPSIYRDFYHGGGPTSVALMNRVFYHNVEDITSMALLAARMAYLFDQPQLHQRVAALHPLECASLARCYETLEWTESCEFAYRTALDGNLPDGERVEILRSLSLWFKRTGRRQEAAEIWETWISSVSDGDLMPYVELAKHHEWHTGDLTAARGWTAWALHLVERSSGGPASPSIARAELQRRLERLEHEAGQRSEQRNPRDEPER